MVALLVQLKLTLLRNSLRRSVWRTVGLVFGMVYALVLVVMALTGLGFLRLGSLACAQDGQEERDSQYPCCLHDLTLQ